jgi:hypothetical protein
MYENVKTITVIEVYTKSSIISKPEMLCTREKKNE